MSICSIIRSSILCRSLSLSFPFMFQWVETLSYPAVPQLPPHDAYNNRCDDAQKHHADNDHPSPLIYKMTEPGEYGQAFTAHYLITSNFLRLCLPADSLISKNRHIAEIVEQCRFAASNNNLSALANRGAGRPTRTPL